MPNVLAILRLISYHLVFLCFIASKALSLPDRETDYLLVMFSAHEFQSLMTLSLDLSRIQSFRNYLKNRETIAGGDK